MEMQDKSRYLDCASMGKRSLPNPIPHYTFCHNPLRCNGNCKRSKPSTSQT